jgi:hypothetical protein
MNLYPTPDYGCGCANLEGDEFDLALDYAADQGWFEDAEVDDDASWVSLTPSGVSAAKS